VQRHYKSFLFILFLLTFTSKLFSLEVILLAPTVSSTTSADGGPDRSTENSSSIFRASIDKNMTLKPQLIARTVREKEIKIMSNLTVNEKQWLLHSIDSFIYKDIGQIKVKKVSSYRRKRERASIEFENGELKIHQKVFDQRNTLVIHKVIAAMAWDRLTEENKNMWSLVSGWTFHPLFIWKETKKGYAIKNDVKIKSSKDDFIQSMLIVSSKKDLSGSRKIFMDQLCEGSMNEIIAENNLHDVRVNFVFVNGKGFLGSSQGHCAIMLDDGRGEKMYYSFGAQMDEKQPLSSLLSALFGNSKMELTQKEYKQFNNEYDKEKRTINTVTIPLNNEQKNRFLFRLFESESNASAHYSFIRQNCAYPVRDIFSYTYLAKREDIKKWQTPKSMYRWALKQKNKKS
jgi:hypothetical protein